MYIVVYRDGLGFSLCGGQRVLYISLDLFTITLILSQNTLDGTVCALMAHLDTLVCSKKRKRKAAC